MTKIERSRVREALSVATALLLVLACAALFAAQAGAHGGETHSDAELAGGTEAHAEADGLTSSYDYARKRAAATSRAKRAAQRRWKRYAATAGITLLSDQQIRERVLLQSLGVPVMTPQDGEGGFASASGDVPISRAGAEITAPTSEQLVKATLSRSDAKTFAANNCSPAECGEWSAPVTPQYDTFEPYAASSTEGDPGNDGFPNPQYDGKANIQFPGDPIKDTSAVYDADPENPNASTANSRYWSPNPRIVPIFEAMLPNGQVIYWDWYYSGNMLDEDQGVDHKKGTRILLWDPAKADVPGYKGIRKDVPGANLFCAGYQQLPNGDLVLAGGNANVALAGLKTTFVYHWRTGEWTQSSDMERVRWYPSVATTWNGEALIVGGDPEDEAGNPAVGQEGFGVPEVFMSTYTNPSTTQSWNAGSPADHVRTLDALDYSWDDPNDPHVPAWRLYPFIFPWVDGRVLYAGRETPVLTIDQRRHAVREGADTSSYNPETDTNDAGDGGDRYVTERADGPNPIVRTYGTGAYYAPGKVLVTGGDADKIYCFSVTAGNRGPGWPGSPANPGCDQPATDLGANPYFGGPKIDDPGDGPNDNWVCNGFEGGNPYKYDSNGNWIGSADVAHVWEVEFCLGKNTPAPDVDENNNHLHNGSSKQSSFITARTTPDGQGNHPGWPTSTQAASMNYPRRMANLTVLPTGKLLSSGGMSTTNANDDAITAGQEITDPDAPTDAPDSEGMDGNNANVNSTLVNYKRAVFAAEQWDPDTNTWKVMANLKLPRMYHSTAILLADGRVMAGGGGVCSTCTFAGYTQANFEFYSPPYLFKSNGALRSPTERPRITGPMHPEGDGVNEGEFLPATDYDKDLSITYSQADGGVPIAKAALVKQGAPTHGFDQSQRYVPVDITVNSSTSLKVRTPANPYEAPPGYYWLFLIDQDGVPSVAKAVQIGASLALENKLRTSQGFRERDLRDPLPDRAGTGQDFGLGSYRASKGNLANIGDNEISSFKLAKGFNAEMCRRDDFLDCIKIPFGTYGLDAGPGDPDPLSPRWEDHISSIRITRATDPNNPSLDDATPANATAFDNASYVDTTGPIISTTLNGTSIDANQVALTYTVVDDVSELDSPNSKINCSIPSGQVVALAVGVNNFYITCTDGVGNATTQPIVIAHQAPLLPPPGSGTDDPPPAKKLKLTIAKKTRITTKLKFKTTCTDRCAVTIGVTATGISHWPKAVILNGSAKQQTVTFTVKKALYKQIAALIKKKKKVRLRAWVNDVLQGTSYLKR